MGCSFDDIDWESLAQMKDEPSPTEKLLQPVMKKVYQGGVGELTYVITRCDLATGCSFDPSLRS